MARQGISKKQVFEVANTLLEEGITPTVQTVREHLGAGSFTTINTHLADWKAAQHDVEQVPDIPEKVMLAFRQAWSVAAHVAQEDIDTQRQTLEAIRREMEQDKAEMASEIERLEKELADSATEAAGLTALLNAQRAEDQTAELRIENARLDERVKAAEGRAEEFKEQLESLQAKFKPSPQEKSA